MGKLEGKVVVITGGSAGIGLATAHRFVAEVKAEGVFKATGRVLRQDLMSILKAAGARSRPSASISIPPARPRCSARRRSVVAGVPITSPS
jgi:NAD(P)-dependent dehydrogenase (short-subunit alcohol dehydrogenase family)